MAKQQYAGEEDIPASAFELATAQNLGTPMRRFIAPHWLTETCFYLLLPVIILGSAIMAPFLLTLLHFNSGSAQPFVVLLLIIGLCTSGVYLILRPLSAILKRYNRRNASQVYLCTHGLLGIGPGGKLTVYYWRNVQAIVAQTLDTSRCSPGRSTGAYGYWEYSLQLKNGRSTNLYGLLAFSALGVPRHRVVAELIEKML